MVKFFSGISLFIFTAVSGWCQMTPRLQEALSNQATELHPVVVAFGNAVNLDSLQLVFEAKNLTPPQRTQIVNRLLLKQAQQSQQSALDFLQEAEIPAHQYRSFYIHNAIVGHLPASAIRALADFPEVTQLDLSTGQLALEDFKKGSPVKGKAAVPGGREPGLEAINATAMWARGYTGRGRTVYVFDSGVWDEHPAFSQRYLGLRRPQNAAWFGLFAPEPSGALSSHGTHVLGTVAGLDQATADTIGVAFKSYWMANDLINASTAAALPPQAFLIQGFEWALNPDGDTTTLYDIPDVINNSWRWRDIIDTAECGGFVPHLMDVIETAGIANVFSGGNTGPNNNGLNSPQRINSNEVNTFCVGSVDANQSFPFPISNFSTRGPSQCPGNGPLSIHPEVVAPGQNVRSAWGADGYNTISGTSMASPHVSGALLLLKEAYPQLTGKTLMEALYNTAVDMGSPGEDNTYGRGLIDVNAAFLLLSQSYTPVDPTTVAHDLDLQVQGVPTGPFTCDTSFNPQLLVTNLGNQAINTFQLSVYRDGQLVHQQNLTSTKLSSLKARDTLLLSAPLSIPVGAHVWAFKAERSVTECDSINNQYFIRLERLPQNALALTEDFENPPFSWQVVNPDGGIGWDTVTVQNWTGNQQALRLDWANYLPSENQPDELYSPNLSLPATGSPIQLTFDYAYQTRGPINALQDTLQIWATDDCGASHTLLYEKAGVDLSTVSGTGRNFVPQDQQDWQRDTVDLSAYQNKNVQLIFRGINRNGNSLYLDNISVYYGPWDPLQKPELAKPSTFKVYPNPASSQITLSGETNQTTTPLQISNGLGQVLWQGSFKGENLTIDCGHWPAGLYFLKAGNNSERALSFVVKP